MTPPFAPGPTPTTNPTKSPQARKNAVQTECTHLESIGPLAVGIEIVHEMHVYLLSSLPLYLSDTLPFCISTCSICQQKQIRSSGLFGSANWQVISQVKLFFRVSPSPCDPSAVPRVTSWRAARSFIEHREARGAGG